MQRYVLQRREVLKAVKKASRSHLMKSGNVSPSIQCASPVIKPGHHCNLLLQLLIFFGLY